MHFEVVGGEITHGPSKGLSRIVAIIILLAIGILVGGLYAWITYVQRSEGNKSAGLESIELSLEPPAAVPIGADTYEIRAGANSSLSIIGVFSNESRLDVSTDPDLTYHLSPCEELSLDETNNRVRGRLVTEEAIPLYVKINDITSNTIYVKVVLPTH